MQSVCPNYRHYRSRTCMHPRKVFLSIHYWTFIYAPKKRTVKGRISILSVAPSASLKSDILWNLQKLAPVRLEAHRLPFPMWSIWSRPLWNVFRANATPTLHFPEISSLVLWIKLQAFLVNELIQNWFDEPFTKYHHSKMLMDIPLKTVCENKSSRWSLTF